MDEDKKELSQEELKATLLAMHKGLVGMQDRLDDHEKVIEKLMMVMENLATSAVPNGFRQPNKH
jgi:hypothetical protein